MVEAMMGFEIEKVSGLGEWTKQRSEKRTLYLAGEKVFLVVNPQTVEVRTDAKLAKLLQEQYESVMTSRYFGNGGIEIVLAGQLDAGEVADLVRLSYNLTVAE